MPNSVYWDEYGQYRKLQLSVNVYVLHAHVYEHVLHPLQEVDVDVYDHHVDVAHS